ncbi:response regulator [Dongia soli]|uniref:Response regulator n=1 Tax=Dongia soli TaxID=600628 RepID=A0ABU5EF93_9PROT|nr:response regulator [Dongia soli]MDY0885002.1 response regulator [Dongia soli]
MKQPTIALVETDILIRYPLSHYLRECGYRVLEACTAEEARQLATARDVAIDIFVLDIAWLGDAGFALAQELRRLNEEWEIITIGSVKRAVKTAADLCEDGPNPSHASDHGNVLALIQKRLSMREKRSA